ncbi:uncharacterized protein BDV17DRAFT_271065 [Aspergillus undulatus]|uniref:uncharacterized protein n=1 Tax=Aspergillus undulatus TaxID=1810928 RepID=UPI003CCC98E2
MRNEQGYHHMAMWMTAFVVCKEQTVLGLLGGSWEPWMKFKNDDGYVHISDESNVFYGDLVPEEQQKHIALLKPQPQLSFKEPALYEPWREIPSMYLFCGKDCSVAVLARCLRKQCRCRCRCSRYTTWVST